MKKLGFGYLIILLTCLIATDAYALSAQEKQELKKWQGVLANRNKSVAKNCGTEIPTSISNSIVKDWVAKKRNATNFFCEEVLGAVNDLCKNPDSKEVALAQIKKIRCMKGKRAGKLGLRIKNNTLFAAFTTETTSIQSKTREWLQKKFKVSGGLSLEENNSWKKWQKSLSGRASNLKKDCGVDITLELDKNIAPPFVKAGKNAYNPCFEALSGIQSLCRAGELKDQFAKRIKSITCGFNEKDPKEPQFKIDGSKLSITYGVEAYGSMDSKARNWLDGEL